MTAHSDWLPLDEAALDGFLFVRDEERAALIAQARTALTLSAQVAEWKEKSESANAEVARAWLERYKARDEAAKLAAECARLREAASAIEASRTRLSVHGRTAWFNRADNAEWDGVEMLKIDALRAALAAPSASEAWLAARDARSRADEREAIALMADAESHKSGAQGYSGEPRHTDFRVFAKTIRQRAESGEA